MCQLPCSIFFDLIERLSSRAHFFYLRCMFLLTCFFGWGISDGREWQCRRRVKLWVRKVINGVAAMNEFSSGQQWHHMSCLVPWPTGSHVYPYKQPYYTHAIANAHAHAHTHTYTRTHSRNHNLLFIHAYSSQEQDSYPNE